MAERYAASGKPGSALIYFDRMAEKYPAAVAAEAGLPERIEALRVAVAQDAISRSAPPRSSSETAR